MNNSSFSYDPFSIAAMTNPQSFYGTLRDRYPAYYMPEYDTWAISRFADVWAGFLDSTHFTEAEGQIISRERLLVHHNGIPPSPPAEPLGAFPILDPPIHTRLRQLMALPLLKPAVNRMEPLVSRLVTERLDLLLDRGAFDLNGDFASYVSAGAVSSLVGLTSDDLAETIRLVNASVAREPGRPGFTEAGLQAVGQLVEMIARAVADRRAGRGREVGLIDAFIRGDVNGRHLGDAEIAQNLVSILIGGAETLPKIVAAGMLELARHPDQLAEVAADPDTRGPVAFEEMLRYNAPAQWFARTVKVERELAGVNLKPGQRVLLLVASANRDPREFENADAFVWNRKARRMVSFGIGPHFCIGIHLARLEGQIMIRELVKRMPRFEIDETAGEWTISEFQIGWAKLPVRIAA
jgi:cytochrome P450